MVYIPVGHFIAIRAALLQVSLNVDLNEFQVRTEIAFVPFHVALYRRA